jgi:hypothetical protein
MVVEAKSVDADALLRVYTLGPNDARVLLLDVRPLKQFKRGHLLHAHCVRLSAGGGALLDYSGASYDVAWSQDCWCAPRGRAPAVLGPGAVQWRPAQLGRAPAGAACARAPRAPHAPHAPLPLPLPAPPRPPLPGGAGP